MWTLPSLNLDVFIVANRDVRNQDPDETDHYMNDDV